MKKELKRILLKTSEEVLNSNNISYVSKTIDVIKDYIRITNDRQIIIDCPLNSDTKNLLNDEYRKMVFKRLELYVDDTTDVMFNYITERKIEVVDNNINIYANMRDSDIDFDYVRNIVPLHEIIINTNINSVSYDGYLSSFDIMKKVLARKDYLLFALDEGDKDKYISFTISYKLDKEKTLGESHIILENIMSDWEKFNDYYEEDDDFVYGDVSLNLNNSSNLGKEIVYTARFWMEP